VGEYPQFLGPTRDGVLPGRVSGATGRLARPSRLAPAVSAGWSGFAVARGRAVTQEQQGDEEQVIAYDANTGPSCGGTLTGRATTPSWPGRSAATPTIHGDRVYTMGATES